MSTRRATPIRVAAAGVLAGGIAATAAIVLLHPLLLLAAAPVTAEWAVQRTLFLLAYGLPVVPLIFLTAALTLVLPALALEQLGRFRAGWMAGAGALAWLGVSALDPTWPWWWGCAVGVAAGLAFHLGVARAHRVSPWAGAVPGILGIAAPPVGLRDILRGRVGTVPALEAMLGVLIGGTVATLVLALVLWRFTLEANTDDGWAMLHFLTIGAYAAPMVVPAVFLVVGLLFVPAHLATMRIGAWRLPTLVAFGAIAVRIAAPLVPVGDIEILLDPVVGAAAGLGFWLGSATVRRGLKRVVSAEAT